jgi:toxin ParE1/3/4
MRYRTTRRANQDIIDIYLRSAAEFGTDQAELYHAELVAAFERLAAHPRIARERTEFSPPVRLHPCGAHMIVYAEHGDGILVIRVLHGRQDWERHL